MGRCECIIKKVLFVIEDKETQCYVAVSAAGDCPIGVQGWHYKSFDPPIPIVNILKEHFDYLTWPLSAPILHITE